MKNITLKILMMFLILQSSCNKETRFAIVTVYPIGVSACRATFKAIGKHGNSKKITEKGFCYSTDKVPEYSDTKISSVTGSSNVFEAEVKELSPHSEYILRAYTKLSDGTIIYGSEVTFRTKDNYLPGDKGPAGGVIFYTNFNYYYEAFIGITPGYSWGCSGKKLGSGSPPIIEGAGDSYSNFIKTNCGSKIAASYCVDLVINGFSDWFLPSLSELGYLYSFSKSNPDIIPPKQYWSSIQKDSLYAYGINFASNTDTMKIDKTSSQSVIAIRVFR